MSRKILHLDLDAFFCAVEELANPKLRGIPFAVGGRPETRGVVASCSYAARQYGIRSAMPMARAISLCPDLRIVSSNYQKYTRYSREVMRILSELTPLVEQVSIDEAFLDVSNINKPAFDVAKSLQARINNELQLPCSIGVATNKLLAKIANDVGKNSISGINPPNTITLVPPGREADFLAPLPVQALWGVGPKTSELMARNGLLTIGDIAITPEIELIRLFGKNGSGFARQSRGIDNRPIYTTHEAKSISNEITFSKDVSEKEKIHETLYRLANKVGARLGKLNFHAKTVSVKIRWPDFSTITRQTTLQHPVSNGEQIYDICLELFNREWHAGQPVRLIGVGVSSLTKEYIQLPLWNNDETNKAQLNQRLLEAMDILHTKYGDHIVKIGIDFRDDDEEQGYLFKRT